MWRAPALALDSPVILPNSIYPADKLKQIHLKDKPKKSNGLRLHNITMLHHAQYMKDNILMSLIIYSPPSNKISEGWSQMVSPWTAVNHGSDGPMSRTCQCQPWPINRESCSDPLTERSRNRYHNVLEQSMRYWLKIQWIHVQHVPSVDR